MSLYEEVVILIFSVNHLENYDDALSKLSLISPLPLVILSNAFKTIETDVAAGVIYIVRRHY